MSRWMTDTDVDGRWMLFERDEEGCWVLFGAEDGYASERIAQRVAVLSYGYEPSEEERL